MNTWVKGEIYAKFMSGQASQSRRIIVATATVHGV